jgi:hypothetical protein
MWADRSRARPPAAESRPLAQSITARSVSGLGIDLIGSQMPTWPLPKWHDPADLWTVPRGANADGTVLIARVTDATIQRPVRHSNATIGIP